MKKFYPGHLAKIAKEFLSTASFLKSHQLSTHRNIVIKSNLSFTGEWFSSLSKIPLILSFSLLAFCTRAQNKVTGITVSPVQTGTLTYGSSSSVTYDINITSDGAASDGSATLSLNWIVPTGVTFSPAAPVSIPSGQTSTDVTLTVSSDGTTPAGTYNFTTTSADSYGDITSASSASFIVNAVPLIISADDQNKTYGATLALSTSAFTPFGLQNGETVGSVTLTSAGAVNTANVSSYSIIASGATGGTFNPANYIISYNDGTLTVNAATLIIAANDRSKTYGTTLALGTSAFTPFGLQNGETVGSVTLTSAGTVNTANVDTYPIVASGAAGGTFDPANYIISYNDGTLTVNAATLIIAANDQSKTYGATLALGTSAFASFGLQNGETIGSVTLTSTGAVNTANVGTYPIVASAATGGTFNPANYIISYNDGTLTVNQASTAMLVTSDNNPSCFGSSVTLTATVTPSSASGNTEFFDGVTSLGTATISGGVATITSSSLAVGPHSIMAQYLGDVNYNGSISSLVTQTVTANSTISLTSAAGTNAQTKCINTAITNITYSTTGATGATFSGLPAGVTGNWAANVATISGTPTTSGTFSYTVTLTGGCGNITATGSITVTANNTITLTSAAGTNAQTKCINTAITNITYSTTGATGATFSGLPAGVTGNWAANVATISGTPTTSGTFSYTVTLTGGCGNITATGSITVTANNTITLTSAAGTNAQTKCINTAITNITYSTTGATGATFSGLPAGVTGNWAANVVTISGTPTASGTFSYTVTLTGGCGNYYSDRFNITVTANNTITLTSAAGTNAQTKCINTAITNITYSTTGATGATFSGLPAGVTGNWAANVATISGTPTTSGTFSYTVTLTGGCGNITATGSITVTANNTITLTSAAGTNAQTKCINTAIINITYSTTGATGATFSGLPAGVTGSWAANVVTISGTPTASGTFSYTVTTTGGCTTPAVTATGTITVTPNNTITRNISCRYRCTNKMYQYCNHQYYLFNNRSHRSYIQRIACWCNRKLGS